MLISGGAFFTSMYFYGMLAFLAMGIVIILFGIVIRPKSAMTLTPDQMRKATQKLSAYGFSTVTLTNQDITALDTYVRRINVAFNFGVGVGIIAGTGASIGLGWYVTLSDPAALQASALIIEGLLFTPIAIGLILGIVLFLVASFAPWRRQPADAEQTAPMTRIPFTLFHPWWLYLMGLAALIASSVFSALLITGVLPTEPIYIPNGVSDIALPPPLWLLLAPPIAITLLLLTMEICARLLYYVHWPAPAGVVSALAERARQRMRLQMILMPATFPFLSIGLLLMETFFLASTDVDAAGVFLAAPLFGIMIILLIYSYPATQRLWKLIPLPEEEKQSE